MNSVWQYEVYALDPLRKPMTIHLVEMPDPALIANALKGDQSCFRVLVTRYGSLVYNFINKRINDREGAEDLTQEVFLKVHQSLHTFDTQRAFKPWLLRIAVNTVISHQRKANVRPQVVSINTLQESDPNHDWVDESGTPETHLESKILSESAQAAMQKLEERYRETLQMRYVDDLSYAQIAQIKGVPMNTVKTWIKRGKDLLQAQIKGLRS